MIQKPAAADGHVHLLADPLDGAPVDRPHRGRAAVAYRGEALDVVRPHQPARRVVHPADVHGRRLVVHEVPHAQRLPRSVEQPVPVLLAHHVGNRVEGVGHHRRVEDVNVARQPAPHRPRQPVQRDRRRRVEVAHLPQRVHPRVRPARAQQRHLVPRHPQHPHQRVFQLALHRPQRLAPPAAPAAASRGTPTRRRRRSAGSGGAKADRRRSPEGLDQAGVADRLVGGD